MHFKAIYNYMMYSLIYISLLLKKKILIMPLHELNLKFYANKKLKKHKKLLNPTDKIELPKFLKISSSIVLFTNTKRDLTFQLPNSFLRQGNFFIGHALKNAERSRENNVIFSYLMSVDNL